MRNRHVKNDFGSITIKTLRYTFEKSDMSAYHGKVSIHQPFTMVGFEREHVETNSAGGPQNPQHPNVPSEAVYYLLNVRQVYSVQGKNGTDPRYQQGFSRLTCSIHCID